MAGNTIIIKQRLDELSNEEWLDAVRAGDLELLDELYLIHREEFLNWARKNFEIKENQAIDIYQQAITSLYEGITNGNILNIEYNPETYVYDIAKALIIRKLRTQNKAFAALDVPILAMQLPPEDQSYDLPRRRATEIMRSMSDPGASILDMFYYQDLKVEQIARRLKYKSKEVIISQKKLCIKTILYKIKAQLAN